jgi:hypothetical protein
LYTAIYRVTGPNKTRETNIIYFIFSSIVLLHSGKQQRRRYFNFFQEHFFLFFSFFVLSPTVFYVETSTFLREVARGNDVRTKFAGIFSSEQTH